MTTYPASSALTSSRFFNARSNGGLLVRCPLLVSIVSCPLDPLRGHDETQLGSSSYAIYGGCGRKSTPCNLHGNFRTKVLGACGNFLGDRELRTAHFLALNGYGGPVRNCSHDGLGNHARGFIVPCNGYGSEKSFYRKASVMGNVNSQRCNKGFPAADRNNGDVERSFRQPLIESEGNTSSANVFREFQNVSINNGDHPRLFREDSAGPLGIDFSLVSDGYSGRESLSKAGSYTASPFQNPTVSVFWDLDNKPPRTSPYHAALYLRKAASQFGSVIDMVAYANHHAFTHIPDWVREERRDRKQLDLLEQRGLVQPEQPYVCNLCGRKCKTNFLLKKHFKQLHEREHNKRMSRLNSLKGRKREKFKTAVQSKTARYKDAARPILVPKVGYGLESDLRRAGVYVRRVQYKPQAADVALKRQMSESMNKGVKCICLVSDDTDFSQMLADAKALNLRTVVFGESKSLKRFADIWLPWDAVSQGLPLHASKELTYAWRRHHEGSIEEQYHNIQAGAVSEVSDVQHRIFAGSNPVRRTSFSVFSDDEHVLEHDEDDGESSSDNEVARFAFDVDDELDDDWEDDSDDGVD